MQDHTETSTVVLRLSTTIIATSLSRRCPSLSGREGVANSSSPCHRLMALGREPRENALKARRHRPLRHPCSPRTFRRRAEIGRSQFRGMERARSMTRVLMARTVSFRFARWFQSILAHHRREVPSRPQGRELRGSTISSIHKHGIGCNRNHRHRLPNLKSQRARSSQQISIATKRTPQGTRRSSRRTRWHLESHSIQRFTPNLQARTSRRTSHHILQQNLNHCPTNRTTWSPLGFNI